MEEKQFLHFREERYMRKSGYAIFFLHQTIFFFPLGVEAAEH